MALYNVPTLNDFSWQPPVEDKDLETSPVGPSKGDRYIVKAKGGDWSGGTAKDITYYNGSDWIFATPVEGWITWVKNENKYYTFDGSSWADSIQAQGDVLDDLNTLGANSADSEFLVGTGAGALAWENAATARTSIGLGNVENTKLSTWAGSANITTLGTIATVGNITLGSHASLTFGVNLAMASSEDAVHFRNTQTNERSIFQVIPRGTIATVAAALQFYGTDFIADNTNYERLNMYANATSYEIFTYAGGTGTVRPLILYTTGNANQLYLKTDGKIGFGVIPITKVTIEGTLTLKEQASADADTAAYGQDWVKNTSPCTRWFTDDAGNDGQFMLMRSASINSDSDAADVQGCNVLWVDTSGGNIVLGGLTNGVDNQLLYVFKYDESNILTIEHQEGTGTQKFMLKSGDYVYDGVGVCLPFICKNGTWYIAAYPRDFST